MLEVGTRGVRPMGEHTFIPYPRLSADVPTVCADGMAVSATDHRTVQTMASLLLAITNLNPSLRTTRYAPLPQLLHSPLTKTYSDLLAREPLHAHGARLRSAAADLLGRHRDDDLLQPLDPDVGHLEHRRATEPAGARREAQVPAQVGLERRPVGVCAPRGRRVFCHGVDACVEARVWGLLELLDYL